MTWKEFLDGRKFTAKERGVLMPGQRVGRVTLTGWYFRWVAQNLPETTLYQFLRMLEVPAIIVALVAFWIDYADRPIDRATRNAQLLAQVAQLATISHANASGGIKAIIEFLADEKVSMRGIALRNTDLRRVDLEVADLRSANLAGTELFESNLRGADLRRANLVGAKLYRANLSGADLRRTIGGRTNFTEVNLSGADLRGANLMYADLTDADLTGAKLTDADLAGVNLTGAIVSQEQLDSACISEDDMPLTLRKGLKPPQKVCMPRIR